MGEIIRGTATLIMQNKRIKQLEEELELLQETLKVIEEQIMKSLIQNKREYEYDTITGKKRFVRNNLKDLQDLKERKIDEARVVDSKLRALDPRRQRADFIAAKF